MSGRPSWPRGLESTTSSDRDEVHDRDHAPEDASPKDAGENDAMLSRATIVHLRRQVRALQQSATRYRSLVDLSTDATYELALEPGSSPPLPPTAPSSHPSDHAAPAPTAETGAAVEKASPAQTGSADSRAQSTLALSWASESFARLLGTSHESLLQANDWRDFVHPHDRSTFDRHRKHVAAGDRMVTEYRLLTPGGSERWVCDYAQPIHRSGGVVRAHGAIREFTHERRHDRALRDSKLKYKHIFNNSPLGIFHFDASGQVTQCNENFANIVGSPRKEMIGLHLIEELQDPDAVQAVHDALDHGRGHYDGDYTSMSGEKVTPVRMLLNGVRSEQGAIEGGVGIVEDVTDRKRHEQELIRARDEAETMNQLKSAFLANMSHEIRTPLTAIIGFADILTDEMPSTHRRIPQLIEQSGKRLLNTLNSVLDLSMLESGEMTLRSTSVDLCVHVADHVEMMRPLAANKNVGLRYHGPDPPVCANVDPGALERILANLIGNAIKFTDQGHVTVEVADAGPAADPGDVVVRVIDTGSGIGDDFLPHLFDMFKQESEGLQRSHEGSGLGLAITKRLVDHLGGDITVESKKGEGSTFTVTFPRADASSGAFYQDAQPLQRHQHGRRLLVVEDIPETQVLVDRILSIHHAVDVVESHAEALRHLDRAAEAGDPYEAVLLDINLDRSSTGMDLLVSMRELSPYASTPAIAMTAFALTGDRERFLKEGFDEYVGKPFTADQLLAAIDNVFTNSETEP